LTSTAKLVVLCLVVVAVTVGVVGAVSYLQSAEHIQGVPQPTPTPSPSPNIPTAIHLSSNMSGTFYLGDTVHMIAQLDKPVAGITVNLYNGGALASNPTAITDATGTVTYDRAPSTAFDYYVVATRP